MKNFTDALNFFSLSKDVSIIELKKAYKRMCIKHHPDKNPNGLEMMKLINSYYDELISNFDDIKNCGYESSSNFAYDEALNDILSTLKNLDGLIIEIIGNWIWLSGNTRDNKDTLKSIGCLWASQKKMWYYRPENYKSHNRKKMSLDEIRSMHGSKGSFTSTNKKIAC